LPRMLPPLKRRSAIPHRHQLTAYNTPLFVRQWRLVARSRTLLGVDGGDILAAP